MKVISVILITAILATMAISGCSDPNPKEKVRGSCYYSDVSKTDITERNNYCWNMGYESACFNPISRDKTYYQVHDFVPNECCEKRPGYKILNPGENGC